MPANTARPDANSDPAQPPRLQVTLPPKRRPGRRGLPEASRLHVWRLGLNADATSPGGVRTPFLYAVERVEWPDRSSQSTGGTVALPHPATPETLRSFAQRLLDLADAAERSPWMALHMGAEPSEEAPAAAGPGGQRPGPHHEP